MARYAGGGSEVRVRGEASEEWLKHAPLDRFRVIHLATHAVVDESSLSRTALALAPGARGGWIPLPRRSRRPQARRGHGGALGLPDGGRRDGGGRGCAGTHHAAGRGGRAVGGRDPMARRRPQHGSTGGGSLRRIGARTAGGGGVAGGEARGASARRSARASGRGSRWSVTRWRAWRWWCRAAAESGPGSGSERGPSSLGAAVYWAVRRRGRSAERAAVPADVAPTHHL